MYMRDLQAGEYRLPWEDSIVHPDETRCGFAAPTRSYGQSAERFSHCFDDLVAACDGFLDELEKRLRG